jgi:hypothetical protein
MKHTFLLWSFFALVLFSWNCNRKTPVEKKPYERVRGTEKIMSPEEQKYKAVAEGMCVCSKPLLDLMKNVEAAKTPEEKQAVMAVQADQMKEETEQAKICMQELEAVHGPMKNLDENKSLDALKEHCPEYYNFIKVGMIK